MPKYGTIAVDSAGELARMCFSFDMKKGASNLDAIRAVNNYPGVTERLNMFVRRCKDYRDRGIEIVFTAHEDIQRVYARGGAITPKGQVPQEPIAVKGWPDLPGRTAPDEFCRAVDNVFHVKYVNGQPTWVMIRESLGGGGEYWDVKARFNPVVGNGRVPSSYTELARQAKEMEAKGQDINWNPTYIWMLYGPFGIGKTRSLMTFPQPILIVDLDKGTKSLSKKEIEANKITIQTFDVEDQGAWGKFVPFMEEAAR